MARLPSRLIFSTLAMLAVSPLVHAGVSIGDTAPPLSIKTWVRGDPIDLAKDMSKRVHVVEFWATWCPPCKASIPVLTTLQKNHGKDLAIIGVTDPDTDRNTPTMIKQFVKDKGSEMDYTVAMDDRGATTAGADGHRGSALLILSVHIASALLAGNRLALNLGGRHVLVQ